MSWQLFGVAGVFFVMAGGLYAAGVVPLWSAVAVQLLAMVAVVVGVLLSFATGWPIKGAQFR